MERENFYILLELSLQPPETDAEVIWEAIQNKKADWSRLRNHPTKGLQAQKNINLIPEIQRVMMNNELREKEVLNALEILKKRKKNKFVEIDRHVDMLMAKGFIDKEEISKLAEMHDIGLNEIQSRVTAKKNENFARIDREIGIHMAKGYITEAEVTKIAKRQSMANDDIRQRVRCPIVKTEKEKLNFQPHLLDKSIENTIKENLKVHNKSSLYDFLGLAESADLKTLQEKAGFKKKELANFSKKDAIITAGGILAGHCVTIFKTDENRLAYDISLAKARLAALDMDINVAAINGKIHHEYLDALIKKAMEFGMDEEEASTYIQSYCKQHQLKIEKKPEKKRLAYIMAGALVLGIIIIIVALTVFSKIHKKNTLKAEYQNVLKKIDKLPEPAKQIKQLEAYISSHEKNEYTLDAGRQINMIQLRINTKEFEKILSQADQLIKKEKLEDALSLYKTHLKTTTREKNKKIINDNIKRVIKLIDDRDFEKLSAIAISGEPDQKIDAFRAYLAAHPKGNHNAQVQKLINEMSNEFYLFVIKKLALYEKTEDWEQSAKLCQTYVDLYINSSSDRLKQLLPVYEEKIKYAKIYESLIQKTADKGNDYEGAQNILKTFLEAYPKSPINDKVQKEIVRLAGLKQIQDMKKAIMVLSKKLLKTNGRFVEKKGGVAIDTKTGLMWAITDSHISKPDTCLTYDQGKTYVEELNIGGYTDWRLPTPDELAGIYNTSPAFPTMTNTDTWYWTSESHKSYSDGWHIKVNVLSRGKSTWTVDGKDAMECGAVRAVRKP